MRNKIIEKLKPIVEDLFQHHSYDELGFVVTSNNLDTLTDDQLLALYDDLFECQG